MPDAPARVLHVLGSLDRGGAETWTVQLLECLDPQRVQVDILVHRRGGAYEEHVRSLGAGIFSCGCPHWPLEYMNNLNRFLREQGPYDVVHSHLHLFSGLVLRVAHGASVPGRIAHARNSRDGQSMTPYRLAYRALMRYWIKRYATHLLAVSTTAAEGTFWKGVVQGGQCRILTGINFSPFQVEGDRERVREELGIPNKSLVVGHVGSFRRQKNHKFLLEVAEQLLEIWPETIFLLMGDGALRRSIEEAVRALGIQRSFRFLGERCDVPQLLRAMDVFVFPSLYEGMPRVLLEAQAAGLPCIASQNITPEAAAWPGSVRFLSLEDEPQVWAQAIVESGREPPSAAKSATAVHQFEARRLSITANANELTELYEKIARTSHE
ncbi:MAG: glycosyltransferase [Candidatus Roizmanbacteria bacterium]|nr:glycosyltransferase [Candidatus Roizmanbacteria bacterium]